MRRRLAPLCGVVFGMALAACWLTSSFEGLTGVGPEDFVPDARSDAPRDVGAEGRADVGPPVDGSGGDSAADVAPSDAPVDAPAFDAGCLASAYVPSILADAPVSYWRLDETAGATVAKDAMNRNDGTYSSAVTLGVPGVLPNDTAASFDGVSAIVTVGQAPSFNGTTPFSLEAWIYPNKIDGTYRGIASNEAPATTPRYGFLLFVQNSNSMNNAGFERWGGNASNPTIAHNLTTNAWFHVVGTFNGTALALFVNGQKMDQATSQIVSIPQTYTFVIGALFSGAQPTFFDGKIDEVAVYDHALDPRCVLAHYHLGTGQPP